MVKVSCSLTVSSHFNFSQPVFKHCFKHHSQYHVLLVFISCLSSSTMLISRLSSFLCLLTTLALLVQFSCSPLLFFTGDISAINQSFLVSKYKADKVVTFTFFLWIDMIEHGPLKSNAVIDQRLIRIEYPTFNKSVKKHLLFIIYEMGNTNQTTSSF